MRVAMRVGGVVCVLVGVVWLLQGANVLGGSRMTGDPFWLWMGVVVAVVGVALVLVRLRRRENLQ